MKSLIKNNLYAIVLLILAFGGLLDASYLTAKHYLKTPVFCSVFSGCETVLTSSYAQIAGIPISLLGAIYYLAVMVLIVLWLPRSALALTGLGVTASLFWVGVQIWVIEAICTYCLISAAISTTLFVLLLIKNIKLKHLGRGA
ncbi:MAG: vitamin K epoxide reductase family protein [Candidatus Doudnabacteria bacterium]|nr:vitamin K epoxide reductase family protein [Candidatus Doudnabacteria bacterium]